MESLYIIIPAYNEEANIKAVVLDWYSVVEKIYGSKLVVIDDGSKDNTYHLLKEMELEKERLKVLAKENSGHGPTLQYGYQYALENNAEYIFQTDSDGQTLVNEFWDFWAKREEYDIIIGKRINRKDGISRIFITKVLKWILWLIFGIVVPDANTPFRLMKNRILKKYLYMLPERFNLTNVLLSVFFIAAGENVLFLPITFRKRQGGKNSINIKHIALIGLKAIGDFFKIKEQMGNEKCFRKLKN